MKPSYEELERYGRQADITIENLERKVEQLAVENAALKSRGRELLGEACAVYAKLNKLIDPAIGDFIDGQTLHEFQFVLDCETPATDAILAEVRASELDSLAGVAETMLVKFANQNASQIPEAKGWEMIQRQTSHRAAQLRQGGAV